MTAQQKNGTNLGYTVAWVICYANLNEGENIKKEILTKWKHKLNEIPLAFDRFFVDKTTTESYNSKGLPPTWITQPSPNRDIQYNVLFEEPQKLLNNIEGT